MAAVALFVHGLRPQAAALARQAGDWLIERGHQVRLPAADADVVGLDPKATDLDADDGALVLAVSLGGDGTMLRAVEAMAPRHVPVLGVNVGRLGYLAGVEPPELLGALEQFFAGDYVLEERMMLSVIVEFSDGESASAGEYLALNEAVTEKMSPGHTIHVAVAIDGRFFTTYAADGLIVATPTGSTAYAFSAGGPIVSSRQRAILLTPVSPHMPFGRSLVLDAAESLRIEVVDDRMVMLTVDGREVARLCRGDAVTCAAAPDPACFVTFDRRDFYGILKAKFGLTDR